MNLMPKKLTESEKLCVCGSKRKKYFYNGRFKGYTTTCGKTQCKVGCKKWANRREYPSKNCKNCGIIFQTKSTTHTFCDTCVGVGHNHFFSKYNITKTEYEKMKKRNNGMCEICKKRKGCVVDHSHKTGSVRGFLCKGCNRDLYAFDNIEQMQNIINYLKKYDN